MAFKNSNKQYGSIAKFFHWTIFFLVIVQIPIGFFWQFTGDFKAMVINWHKCLGLFILILVFLRLLWALYNPKPVLSHTMPSEKMIERLVHGSLYVCLFLLPLSGWIVTTAIDKPPRLLGYKLNLPGIPYNKTLATTFLSLHLLLIGIFSGLLVLHILAALKHHFVNKDNILRRMLPNKWL